MRLLSPRTFDRFYASHANEDVSPGFESHVLAFRATGVWPSDTDSHWYKLFTASFFISIGFLFPLTLVLNILWASTITDEMDTVFPANIAMLASLHAIVFLWQQNRIREFFSRSHGTRARVGQQ